MSSRVGRGGRLALGITLPLLLIAFLFLGGEFLERGVRNNQDLSRPSRAIEGLLVRLDGKLPRLQGDKRLLEAGLPVYDLRLGPKQLDRFYRAIELVQSRGNALGLDIGRYERAHFLQNGHWVPIRTKLRGFEINHFNKGRPSLRLKFPPERPFRGMRRINLVDPYDKGLTADLTTGWEAARHGIICWQSRFVVLRVNDDVWGIYLEIEQPGEEMVARHDRAEGPIYSPNGILYGKQGTLNEKAKDALTQVSACIDPTSTTNPCDWKFITNNFDVDRLAWAAAIMTMCGHWGAWLADNLRFYFDPARGRFEPVPWDYGYWPLTEGPTDWSVFPGRPPPGSLIGGGEGLSELGVVLLRIPEFRRMRDERLWTLATTRVDTMLQYAEQTYRSVEDAFRLDERGLSHGRARTEHRSFVTTLQANAALHQKLLSRDSLVVCIPPSSEDVTPLAVFENHGRAAVEILALDTPGEGTDSEMKLIPSPIVPGKWNNEPGRVRIPLRFGVGEGRIRAENTATGRPLPATAIHFTTLSTTSLPTKEEPTGESRFVGGPGILVEGDRIRVGPGRVELNRTLEIPEGYQVVLVPGLELRLDGGVSLIVRGDLDARGTPDHPIRIRPANPAVPWGTLAVLGVRVSPSTVTMANTTIEGGSGGETTRIRFSGSFSVHDGVVSMQDVEIFNVQAEDGINLKYCTVNLDRCRIRNATSDAIDLDFCTGTIDEVSISDVGGDGFDLSGSRVILEGNTIVRTGDKGVSVGERSYPILRNNRIEGGGMGVAVKDASVATILDTWISGQEVGVSVYVKKPSYEGPRAILNRVRIEDCSTDYLKDGLSVIVVDGDTIR